MKPACVLPSSHSRYSSLQHAGASYGLPVAFVKLRPALLLTVSPPRKRRLGRAAYWIVSGPELPARLPMNHVRPTRLDYRAPSRVAASACVHVGRNAAR